VLRARRSNKREHPKAEGNSGRILSHFATSLLDETISLCIAWDDGLVTTLVFIMAVSQIAPARLLLVMLGEVLAGGISMALGGYLSARTAKQILEQRIATERYEIEHEPEEERAELVSIYQNKGFTGPLLQHVVNHLAANQERWHRAMVHDELGVVEDTLINPWLEGVQIGLSFVLGGLIPMVPLLLPLLQASWWAYGLTALSALALGAIKARYTRQGPVWAGLEFLVVLLGSWPAWVLVCFYMVGECGCFLTWTQRR
jgi:VIT1/CCC1 family predicted Fe2+/Mn2+ transporter